MKRRDFLFGIGAFVISIFSRCQSESDLSDESFNRDLPRQGASSNYDLGHSSPDLSQNTSSDLGYSSLSDLAGNPKDDNQINPAQSKISVLKDLKERLNGTEIEITFDENGEPYVKSISGFGVDCFYFTVNGKPYIGEGINVESVFVNPLKDIVRWYCNGQLLNL
ncbi:MAG: hypothetical protein AB1465_03065 [Patescibacteria group bacterium]